MRSDVEHASGATQQALFWLCAGLIALVLTGCTPVGRSYSRAATALATTPGPSATPDRWQEIRQWTPYPHTTPLPPRVATPIDGVYVRLDPRTISRTPCRRCPAYPPEGGVWKLVLDKGTFWVYHPRTGWRTLGAYAVAGDQITLFNDPYCHTAVGIYRWQMDARVLRMQLVADDCELGTRVLNFTSQPWASCQPPNHEAAVTDHWAPPEGCE